MWYYSFILVESEVNTANIDARERKTIWTSIETMIRVKSTPKC